MQYLPYVDRCTWPNIPCGPHYIENGTGHSTLKIPTYAPHDTIYAAVWYSHIVIFTNKLSSDEVAIEANFVCPYCNNMASTRSTIFLHGDAFLWTKTTILSCWIFYSTNCYYLLLDMVPMHFFGRVIRFFILILFMSHWIVMPL